MQQPSCLRGIAHVELENAPQNIDMLVAGGLWLLTPQSSMLSVQPFAAMAYTSLSLVTDITDSNISHLHYHSW